MVNFGKNWNFAKIKSSRGSDFGIKSFEKPENLHFQNRQHHGSAPMRQKTADLQPVTVETMHSMEKR